MSNRILHICNEEGIHLDSEALSTLSSISHGDLRRAITYLQGAARLYGSSISSKDLISVSGVIPDEVVQALFAACKSGNFDLANKEVDNIIAEGYPVSLMLSQLFDVIVEATDIWSSGQVYVLYEGDTISGNFVIVDHDVYWTEDHPVVDFMILLKYTLDV